MRILLATQIMHRRLVVIVLAGLLLLTTAGVAAGSDTKFIETPDSKSNDAVATKPFATLTPDKVTLQFYEVRLADGRVGGIAISQSVRASYRGIDAVPRLQNANALEIYNALSAPRTRIPAQLMTLYGKPSLGQQGWALPLPLANPSDPQAYSCMAGAESFKNFSDIVTSRGYPFVFLSNADGPTTQPNHWFESLNGDASANHQDLQGGVSNVEHFFGRVSYCVEEAIEQPAVHGRYVSFRYKVSGSDTWVTGESGQLYDPGDNVTYEYSMLPGVDADISFRLNITQARPYDQFHIGATWADPDETITYGD